MVSETALWGKYLQRRDTLTYFSIQHYMGQIETEPAETSINVQNVGQAGLLKMKSLK